jgi:hypothetical protein
VAFPNTQRLRGGWQGRMITKNRLTKLLSILVIVPLLVCSGMVGCGPTVGPAAPIPGGPPPAPPTPGGPPPGGEVAIMFVAEPDTIPQGGCSVLRWEVNPPGVGRVLVDGQEVPQAGERGVCPPGTTTYQLLVETAGGPQTREVVVNVGGGPLGPGPQPTPPGPGPAPTGGPGGGCAGPPTLTYFTASASTITAGQQVQLRWGEVRNGTSGPLVGSVVLSPGGFGEVGSPGSRWASPTTTTTYRLTATGCGGTATKDLTVTVGGAAPAATSTPHPGGPTATKQATAAAGTATRTPTRTPTPTTAVILGTVIPFVPAATATPGVQVRNGCGRTIGAIYIRKSGESSWGSDRLGVTGDYLAANQSRTIPLAEGSYQARAECCGGLVVSEVSMTLGPGSTYGWYILAALDIHNDTGEQIEELHIMEGGAWSDDVLEKDLSWPGCGSYPHSIPAYGRLRCYLPPGTSYSLRAVTSSGTEYTAMNPDIEGNSAWYVNTEFWTPPADY